MDPAPLTVQETQLRFLTPLTCILMLLISTIQPMLGQINRIALFLFLAPLLPALPLDTFAAIQLRPQIPRVQTVL